MIVAGNRRRKQDRGRYRHWRNEKLERLRRKEDEREMDSATPELGVLPGCNGENFSESDPGFKMKTARF